MSRGSIFACAAVLVVLSAAPAAAQPPRDIFERKQAFVAAIRQFSISIAGRFGDEGRRLRADVDAMESALREWDQAIAAFETALRAGRLDADAYIALGSVQLDRHRVQDAVAIVQRGGQAGPEARRRSRTARDGARARRSARRGGQGPGTRRHAPARQRRRALRNRALRDGRRHGTGLHGGLRGLSTCGRQARWRAARAA